MEEFAQRMADNAEKGINAKYLRLAHDLREAAEEVERAHTHKLSRHQLAPHTDRASLLGAIVTNLNTSARVHDVMLAAAELDVLIATDGSVYS